MLKTSRRTFLGTGAALSLGSLGSPAFAQASADEDIEADLLRYVRFGNKRAGGPGDSACGEWLAGALAQFGYAVERQPIAVPFFEAEQANLVCGTDTAPIYPQPIVIDTGPGGISGPIVRVDSQGRFAGSLNDAIALVDLPHARWSSMLARAARDPIRAAFAAGAGAVVAIPNGPTGKVIALNTDGRRPMFAGPVGLIAPEAAGPFLAAAYERRMARLTIHGASGQRPAFNLVGRMNRRKGRWLAISTPRSGWFACAGERGGGVAAWLHLARWAAAGLPDHDLAFICNSGHEYEYLGAAEAMAEIAPPVRATSFWLHLGANVASRDWHDISGTPLSNVDSQRYLSVSPELLPLARSIFASQPGYQDPVSSRVLSAGELDEVIRAGYAPAAGVFGIHRYHHVAEDDERCLNLPGTVAAAQQFRRFLETIARNAGS